MYVRDYNYSIAPSGVVGTPMGVADKSPARFYLKNAIVDSADQTTLWQLPQALADYQAAKRAHKASLKAVGAG